MGTGCLGLPLAALVLTGLPGAQAAAEGAGVIAASVVTAALLLCLFIGLAFFCFYRKGGIFKTKTEKRPRHRKKRQVVYHENGYLPPPYYDKRHIPPPYMNGYMKQIPAPMHRAGPYPAFIEPAPIPVPHPTGYATYHGPPPEIRHHESVPRSGTLSGPPPIVIPYGTVTVRPDPRPVIHKTKRRTRDKPEESGDRRKSPERRPPRQSQEFIVQQSYDGIPVIRPVIYIDDDDDRGRKRSKSRDHRYKKKADKPSPSPKIREINTDDTEVKVPNTTEAEVTIVPQTLTPPQSRGVTSAERSRASSVTEAVNALKRSVNAYDTDSVSSRAPSFRWMHSEPAPTPVPAPVTGDVMFFPADAHVETTRHEHKADSETREDNDYVYTQVIKQSVREDSTTKTDDKEKENVYGYTKVIRSYRESGRDSPVAAAASSATNEGYEVPVRRATKGTRDEDVPYETEHSRRPVDFSKAGASMSDRLQHMVEDGDKTRFSHYNLGAMNFGTEEEDEIEPVQLRVKRPETPPNDIPRSSFYSQSHKRPKTPPNDIPLVTPRESTEVPPLNLPSQMTSPRDPYTSYRPPTPPTDFTPRPPTPPLFFGSKPKSDRPETPPFDGPNTSRSAAASPLNRSMAVDPATGEPGSFHARARLIEAHLKRNQGGTPTPKPSTTTAVPKFKQAAPAPPKPPGPTVHVTPGVVPPAPPPPPVPK
ncbi:proteoglycan 4-like [Mya arenaria]|uniref:proteoglycan 4-like n=1 Tax=Mya arenaria TaxID=6604 RepID=UPI0022E674C8|nr:proteoglycan 4-like [Mya arenaria]